MVLNELGTRITNALMRLTAAEHVDEEVFKETLKEVTNALAASDVALPLVVKMRKAVQDNDEIVSLFHKLIHTTLGNFCGICVGVTTIKWNLGTCGILTELCKGTGTECICTNKTCTESLSLVEISKFGCCCCLSATLKSNKHNDIAFSLLGLIWTHTRIQQGL